MLAATWAGDAASRRVDEITEALTGWRLIRGPGWLIAGENGASTAETELIAAATTVQHVFDRDAGVLRDARSLAVNLQEDATGVVGRLGAPFRLLWAEKASGVVHGAADSSGLGHLFTTRSADMALCSSSASLLARLTGARPSRVSLAAFAQFGAFPFDATPYQGIAKLPAGSRLSSEAGEMRIADAPFPATVAPDLEGAFAGAVEAMLRAAPQAALELSGGLDSRLILAAMPRSERSGRVAITLDDSGGRSAEARIAREVAEATELDHRLVPLGLDLLDGDRLLGLLDRTIDGYDHMANPLDKLPLVLAGQDHDEVARFGGQNGEIIRGFYYPMQPLDRRASAELVEKLVDWRLIANDRASPRLFSPAGADAMATAREEMRRALSTFQGSWGEALDQFYLRYRMQAWAGNAASNRFVGRAILWPFFDDRFLHAAMALPAARKDQSKVAYQLLLTLDRLLAAIPLDNGHRPDAFARGGLRVRATKWSTTLRKGSRKLVQRLIPAATAVIGSDRLIAAWREQGGFRALDADRLASLDLFDEDAIEALTSGAWTPDRATLGFVLLCNRIVGR